MKTYQNIWDSGKIVFWGKSIALNVYIREKEKSKINDLECYCRELKYKPKLKAKYIGGTNE